MGTDLEVMVKPVLKNWEKVDIAFDGNGNPGGWTTRENWAIELQNSKEIDVVVDVRRNFGGDWALTSDEDYEKVDAEMAATSACGFANVGQVLQ